ncbi:PREDICTED: F-box protein At3g07870-like [Erythranthe guttata]|uniref:F-box protein At3g07870-like n=1 Tax=Erythranthe guttata TaxID=4155 RepID=UPI00064D7598|nr:PREDICTED: F-box protein At3g07870-like [Erythranthe guttata]|eukprot:XP_012852427.1 PREDICTED: F-box protein At3g07870-like [Erythranthe guttata]
MSDYIPRELQIQILQKLPVKSLIRFTAVCKSWRSIITSTDFISSHLSNGKNDSLLLLIRGDRHNILDQLSLLKVAENVPFDVSSSSQLEVPFDDGIEYYKIVGSCDGLLCLSDETSRKLEHSHITIWNPCVRNHLHLPLPNINPEEDHSVALGFGVASHAYIKVVRLVYIYNNLGDDFRLIVPPQVEVFSDDKWRWRRLTGVSVTLTVMDWQAFFNGVVHWLGFEPIDAYNSRNSILAFDIVDEVFSEVMLPDELASEDIAHLRILVIGESFGVVKHDRDDAYDVWVMKEYCVKESWTKLYTIDHLIGKIENLFKFWKSGEALLEVKGYGLVVYNPETKMPKVLGINGYVYHYAESLLLFSGLSRWNSLELHLRHCESLKHRRSFFGEEYVAGKHR